MRFPFSRPSLNISSSLFRKTRNKHCFFSEKFDFVTLLAATRYLLTQVAGRVANQIAAFTILYE